MLMSPYQQTFIYFMIILPATQALVGKTKLFRNCFRNPTSTCVTENSEKHNYGKQPTVDCFLKPIRHSGAKHSVGKYIPHKNFGRQETPWKLRCSLP